jgi:hypothetical protein
MKIKELLRRLHKGERGQTLILALVMLVLGGLIIPPLLVFMSTGLLAGQKMELDVSANYAADAGVESAIWHVKNGGNYLEYVDDYGRVGLPYEDSPFREYSITVGDRDVDVTLSFVPDAAVPGTHAVYRIEANTADSRADANIVSYLIDVTGDYSGITNFVITSQNEIDIDGPSSTTPDWGEEHGPQDNYSGEWPAPSHISQFYYLQVEDTTPYAFSDVDISANNILETGAFFRDGTLEVTSSSNTHLTVTLNDTLYITGDTQIGVTGKEFTLDLNGQTIYIESSTAGNQYALRMGTKLTLTGTGCIIGIGDLQIKPNMDANPDDYILVLSISGKTYMQPNGDFYGTLAGSTVVNMQNGDIVWTATDEIIASLNLPGPVQGVFWKIETWEIS